MHAWKRVVLASFFFAVGLQVDVAAGDESPRTHTFKYNDSDRVYSVFLPRGFDPSATYWPLFVVHGGGGRGVTNPKAIAMRRVADELDLPAILITPDFVVKDKNVSRFPMLGEEAFLKAVLQQVRGKYNLRSKVLLTGYSMGGQFTHRFALGNPDLVHACAPLAAGTWTTPDGRLLIEDYGEVENAEAFLSSTTNVTKIPARLSGLFDARVAQVAERPMADGAEKIPFLVMCGTLDTRWSIALEFASSLKNSGFNVQTEWPVTPHGSKVGRHKAEFAKYPQHVIEFFKKHAE
ncbi:MAG: hypothetical protein ACR2NZ_09345 [Rubripirellula sp.]